VGLCEAFFHFLTASGGISPKFDNGYVIYSGELTPEVDGIKFVNFKDTASVLS
jgi:hypothetical protein